MVELGLSLEGADVDHTQPGIALERHDNDATIMAIAREAWCQSDVSGRRHSSRRPRPRTRSADASGGHSGRSRSTSELGQPQVRDVATHAGRARPAPPRRPRGRAPPGRTRAGFAASAAMRPSARRGARRSSTAVSGQSSAFSASAASTPRHTPRAAEHGERDAEGRPVGQVDGHAELAPVAVRRDQPADQAAAGCDSRRSPRRRRRLGGRPHAGRDRPRGRSPQRPPHAHRRPGTIVRTTSRAT